MHRMSILICMIAGLLGCQSPLRLPVFFQGTVYEQELASARLWEQQGELLRAEQAYQQLVQQHPRRPEAYQRLGVVAQKRGDSRTAVERLQQARDLSPMSVEVLADLGFALYLDQRHEEAVRVLQQGQQLNPSHPRVQHNLALALVGTQNVDSARLILTQQSGEAAAHVSLGFMLAQHGRMDDARRAFEQALEVDPQHRPAAEALVQLARAHTPQQSAPVAESGPRQLSAQVAVRDKRNSEPALFTAAAGRTPADSAPASAAAAAPRTTPSPMADTMAEAMEVDAAPAVRSSLSRVLADNRPANLPDDTAVPSGRARVASVTASGNTGSGSSARPVSYASDAFERTSLAVSRGTADLVERTPPAVARVELLPAPADPQESAVSEPLVPQRGLDRRIAEERRFAAIEQQVAPVIVNSSEPGPLEAEFFEAASSAQEPPDDLQEPARLQEMDAVAEIAPLSPLDSAPRNDLPDSVLPAAPLAEDLAATAVVTGDTDQQAGSSPAEFRPAAGEVSHLSPIELLAVARDRSRPASERIESAAVLARRQPVVGLKELMSLRNEYSDQDRCRIWMAVRDIDDLGRAEGPWLLSVFRQTRNHERIEAALTIQHLYGWTDFAVQAIEPLAATAEGDVQEHALHALRALRRETP